MLSGKVKSLTNYFKTTSGSLIFIMIMFVFALILHVDFWNWGKQNIYFGWIPGEYLYRTLLISVGYSAFNYIIQIFSWPLPKEYKTLKK